MKANTYLGSEDWYKFVTACNKSAIDLHYDAHYKWSIKVREFVAYESCENSLKIAKLIEKLRERHWTVVILTTRKKDMEHVTLQHIQQTGLPFTKEAIFDFMKKFAQEEQFPFMTKEEYQIAKSSNMI
ncbi:DUF2608 domain-containing protein [Candidatus Protochlamydia amoebophila]|uniref:Uncharacterized protein n=1 Tax=Protochlamydia amoebophila (strain UWE25) TaxID=264201 RepID=A0A2P9H9P0_PARUW|nr:DUF2608 domain-containing protein [Candidatus Protochlamydia amoebophila]SPJ31718.1 unnamed protein product [Candidatus Protochlamydia amoebophila UWE25]